MLKLNNVKIAIRIAIACLVPILAFTAFAVNGILEKRSIYANAERIAAIAQIAPDVSGLIHELQRERGATDHSSVRGFRVASAGKRPKSRSALHSSSTP